MDRAEKKEAVAALREADVLFLSVRRRTPPQEQLEAVRAHLDAGKPLVGIRTACHAFSPLPNAPVTDPRLDTRGQSAGEWQRMRVAEHE